MQSKLEHINLTVTDPHAAANILSDIFDWKIRWSGASLDQGFTVHLGGEDTYLALYSHDEKLVSQQSHKAISNLNHIGIQVENLDMVEQKVKSHGFKAYNHGN